MKHFKLLQLALFAVFALVACNVDDLRDDLDALEARVTSLEAQVALLNDNMTAIKQLLSGGETIASCTESDGTYTIVLSDGTTITLTQGEEGEIVYPEISVNSDGYWVVNGEILTDSDGNYVSATGEAGATPTFRLTDEGSYWQVSTDGGETWEYVLDESGNYVSAVSDDSSSSSSGSAFFTEVEITDEYLILTMTDGTVFSIPIASTVSCSITEPEDDMVNGYWQIACGTTATTTVTVVGENVIVTAPSGWEAYIGEIGDDNTATLYVTAPSTATTISSSGALADNSCDLSIQVNTGSSWAVAKIQVQAIDVSYYYDLYMAGETLTIGNIEVNYETYGDATLISSDSESTEITAAGVYFIDPDVEATYNCSNGCALMIIIGNNSSKKSTLYLSQQIKLANGASGVFACQNLIYDASDINNYSVVQNYNGAYANVIFDGCEIHVYTGKTLSYISSSARSFGNFYMCNCVIPLAAGSTSQFIIGVGSSATSAFGSVTFKNNVFYSTTSGSAATAFKLYNFNTGSIEELTVENNTFVNAYTATTFYVYMNYVTTANISNNLIWGDATMGNAMGVLRCTTYPTSGTCTDNIYYKGDSSSYAWQIFYGGTSTNGFDGAEEITQVSDDPFSGGTFDVTSGSFVPGSSYSSYGASID